MPAGLIQLTVPGELIYRDVAIRAVAAACRLARSGEGTTDTGAPLDLRDDFDAQLVSAVSEIFNNIVIHGADPEVDEALPIDFEIRITDVAIDVVITDHGTAFDIESVPTPELEQLPEGGMGIHIARSCVDDLDYTPGPPNRWHMTKRTVGGSTRVAASRRRPSTQA